MIVEAKIAQSQSEVTPEQSMPPALEQLHTWDTAGAWLELRLTGPDETNFKLIGRLQNVTDSLFALSWSTDTSDSLPKRSFAHSDGTTVISLEDATVVLSDDSRPAMIISRGPFRCTLTELRASGFA